MLLFQIGQCVSTSESVPNSFIYIYINLYAKVLSNTAGDGLALNRHH